MTFRIVKHTPSISVTKWLHCCFISVHSLFYSSMAIKVLTTWLSKLKSMKFAALKREWFLLWFYQLRYANSTNHGTNSNQFSHHRFISTCFQTLPSVWRFKHSEKERKIHSYYVEINSVWNLLPKNRNI